MGDTPLLKAARNGHWGTALLLVDQGANIAQQSHDGGTVLDYVLQQDGRDHSDLVYRLVKAVGQQGNVSLLQIYFGSQAQLHCESSNI